ncbi:MAG: hypothetical protein U1U88_000849 [Lawsonella clevelandensis]
MALSSAWTLSPRPPSRLQCLHPGSCTGQVGPALVVLVEANRQSHAGLVSSCWAWGLAQWLLGVGVAIG